MNKKTRNIHIGNDVWKYILDGMEVRIYDKNRKMYRVPTKNIIKLLGDSYSDGLTHPHTPSSIKMYISDVIIANNVLNNVKI